MSKKGESKEAAVKAFKVAGDRAGVKGFIVGFEEDGLVTTHMEGIKMSSVSRIVIALFSQMCDFEAAQGHMSEQYRATMIEMKNEFLDLIKRFNAKFEAIRNSGKTKTT